MSSFVSAIFPPDDEERDDMSNVEKVLAAGLAGACLAAIAVIVAVGIGGDRQFIAAVLRDPLSWLLWPGGLGAIGGAAHQISKH